MGAAAFFELVRLRVRLDFLGMGSFTGSSSQSQIFHHRGTKDTEGSPTHRAHDIAMATIHPQKTNNVLVAPAMSKTQLQEEPSVSLRCAQGRLFVPLW